MPKEWTHWFLASEVSDRITKTQPSITPPASLSGILAAHESEFLLGATAPDLLYYLLRDAPGGGARHAADRVHGASGEDTFLFFRNVARLFGERPLPSPVIAFLCGFATHIFADATFHPLVYFFCNRSTERHWYFETVLDLMVRTSSPEIPRTVAQIKRGIADGGESQIIEALAAGFFGGAREGDGPVIVRRAMASWVRIQRSFVSQAGYRLISSLGWLGPAVSRVRRLFYRFPTEESVATFSHRITSGVEFRHPVTGERSRATFDSLRDEYIGQCVPAVCSLFEGLTDPERRRSWEQMRGPSLETGLPPGSPVQFRYTAETEYDALFAAGL